MIFLNIRLHKNTCQGNPLLTTKFIFSHGKSNIRLASRTPPSDQLPLSSSSELRFSNPPQPPFPDEFPGSDPSNSCFARVSGIRPPFILNNGLQPAMKKYIPGYPLLSLFEINHYSRHWFPKQLVQN